MQAVQATKPYEDQQKEEGTFPEVDSDLLRLIGSSSRSQQIDMKENQHRAINEVRTALMRLKLSRNEVRAYIFLARHGAQKAQNIANSLGVQRTEAYKILRSLENEGVVNRVLERPMRFAAIPLEQVLDGEIEVRRQRIYKLERKRDELLNLWKTLPMIEQTEEKGTLQVFEGKRQVGARAAELLKATEKTMSAVVSDRHLVWLYNSTFFEDLEDLPKGKNIEVKILTNYTPTSTFVIEEVQSNSCDFAFLHTRDQPSFILTDTGTLILLLDDNDGKFYAMETTYDSMVRSFENLFELLWKCQRSEKELD